MMSRSDLPSHKASLISINYVFDAHASDTRFVSSVDQVKEIEALLGGMNGLSQIIWTSSSNARRDAFSIDDLQHRNGLVDFDTINS